MKEYGIPKKFQNLVIMTLQETKGKVKVLGELSGEYMINCGFKARRCL
jgi:hypothetical protein